MSVLCQALDKRLIVGWLFDESTPQHYNVISLAHLARSDCVRARVCV
jgi:hypothetical protein